MAIPAAGARPRASDWLTVFPLNTDAWTTFTPTWTQGGTTITHGTNDAVYWRVGRDIIAQYALTATGAGTANNIIGLTLPVLAATARLVSFQSPLGEFVFNDNGVGFYSGKACYNSGGSSVIFRQDNQAGGTVFLGQTGTNNFGAAIGVGDVLTAQVRYEAAS